MKNYKKRLHAIRAFIFDVDGVLGSSIVLLHSSGELLRTMNIKDGYALQYAVRQGYLIGIISGGKSDAVKQRFENLGIRDVYMASSSKIDCYNDFIKKYNLTDEAVLYVGDDIPDLQVMKKAGIAVCPSDASEEIKSVSDYISPYKGGEGCAREIIKQVLKLQGKWMAEGACNW